jgi:hypothetical protein
LDDRFAHVAQSVEHFLGKEEVAGSIPAVGFERTLARIRCRARGKIENSHGSNQRINRIGVRRLQAAQLYDDPQQKEADREVPDQEVLSQLSQSHAAQRDQD